jgi:hypothetical protein
MTFDLFSSSYAGDSVSFGMVTPGDVGSTLGG